MNELEIVEIVAKALRVNSEMHPRPTQVNQTQAAQMLGISHPIVRKLVRKLEKKWLVIQFFHRASGVRK